MIYIHGLDLRNVVVFDDVSVDFTPGVINVRGINLDSDPASPTGNAVGKTLLFSAIPNLRYQATHLSNRKKSRKDLLGRKGSQVGALIQNDDGPEYEVLQLPSKYVIYKDGEDEKVRGLPNQEKYLERIFPIQPEDFYAYAFVSTQRPYEIQTGTDIQRLQLFAKMFRLDDFDLLKEHFAKKGRSISDNEIRVATLEQQRQDLKRKIRKLKQPISSTEYKKVSAQLDAYKADVEKIRSEMAALNSKRSVLMTLLEVEQKLDSLRKKYKHSKSPDVVLEQMKELRDAARDWDRYKHESKVAEKQKAKLFERLGEFKSPKQPPEFLKQELKALESSLYKAEEDLTELRAKLREHARWNENYAEAKFEFEQFGIKASDIDLGKDYSGEEAQYRVTLGLKKLLDHKHSDSAECPTCLQDVDLNAIRQNVKQAERKLAQIEKLRGAQAALQVLRRLKEKKPFELKPDVDEKFLRSEIERCKLGIKSCESDLQRHKDIKAIQTQIEEIDVPRKPKVSEPDIDLEQIDANIDQCHAILKQLEAKKRLVKEHGIDLRSAVKVQQAIDAIDAEFEKLSKKKKAQDSAAGTLLAQVEEYRRYKNSKSVYESGLADVDSQIAKYQDGLKQKKLITILHKAYGNKGLKAQAVNDICRLYESNLNHYRSLVFLEPFQFSVSATEAGVSIRVDRNNGKADAVSDVRHLSGAESDAFRALSVAALLPLVPNSRRLNLLILDEPMSHMDDRYKALFKEQFIPVMRELVPTLVIISPHENDICQDSKIWTITKQHGVSSLKIH